MQFAVCIMQFARRMTQFAGCIMLPAGGMMQSASFVWQFGRAETEIPVSVAQIGSGAKQTPRCAARFPIFVMQIRVSAGCAGCFVLQAVVCDAERRTKLSPKSSTAFSLQAARFSPRPSPQ
jgi:hypothetical protein